MPLELVRLLQIVFRSFSSRNDLRAKGYGIDESCSNGDRLYIIDCRPNTTNGEPHPLYVQSLL